MKLSTDERSAPGGLGGNLALRRKSGRVIQAARCFRDGQRGAAAVRAQPAWPLDEQELGHWRPAIGFYSLPVARVLLSPYSSGDLRQDIMLARQCAGSPQADLRKSLAGRLHTELAGLREIAGALDRIRGYAIATCVALA